jgi:hypothetical protein
VVGLVEEILTAAKKHLKGTELNTDERDRIRAVTDGIEQILLSEKRETKIPF